MRPYAAAQVTAAEAAVAKLIGEAENPDYEGKAGKKWRAEADRCAQKAEEVAKEKDRLFDAGDKARGYEKVKEVKEWQRKMHGGAVQVEFRLPKA